MDQRRVDNILDSGTIHLKIRSFVYLKAVNVKKNQTGGSLHTMKKQILL